MLARNTLCQAAAVTAYNGCPAKAPHNTHYIGGALMYNFLLRSNNQLLHIYSGCLSNNTNAPAGQPAVMGTGMDVSRPDGHRDLKAPHNSATAHDINKPVPQTATVPL